MRKFFTGAIACAITFFGANKIYAQSGEITGQVGDAANKEILVGVAGDSRRYCGNVYKRYRFLSLAGKRRST